MSIPEELPRREDRLAAIADAKAKIEARAAERCAREQADYEAKLAAREQRAAATGKNPGGKPPTAPAPGPRPADQINLTDEESRIMPVAGGGFEQCYIPVSSDFSFKSLAQDAEAWLSLPPWLTTG